MIGVAGISASADTAPAPVLADVIDFEEVEAIIPSAAKLERLEEVREAVHRSDSDGVTEPWFDEKSGKIVIGKSDDTDTADLKNLLATVGGIGVMVAEVDHDQEELDEVVEDVYSQPGLETITSAYHDYEGNRVVLTSSGPPTEELRAAVYDIYGDTAVLESQAFTATPMAQVSRASDVSAFYSGAKYDKLTGGSCTAGFAWRTAKGGPRMLTAGHCLPQMGHDVISTDSGDNNFYLMGTQAGSTFVTGTGTVGSDGDLAMINVEAYDRSSAPRMWTQGPTSSTSTIVTSVDRWTTNGQAVCYSGMKRGVQCGSSVDDDGYGGYNVQDANASYRDRGTGAEYTHVAFATKGWGKCPQRGDSGAPVYINTSGVGVAAHGIFSGGGGGDGDQYVSRFELDNCRLYFTEIGQAYQHFDGGGYVATTS